VRDAVESQVAIAAALVVRDLPAHALGEDLGAAAGQRVEPASISSRSTCSSVLP
jgi:hypothetical protein